ncbi:MAG: hypothetical protein QGI63_08135 [Rhodospirillales bacterium]|nr:hypothetical protein [Rhodospirillales bacterium]MDP6774222.1 hypothetical protein [Rhodospirillales bacterium]
MTRPRDLPRRLAATLAVLLLCGVGADAADNKDSIDGRVPLPRPAKGKGESCIEPTASMRRYHMDYLAHQRDETVRQGIRGRKYSLKECVACHAVPEPGQEEAKTLTVEPFCGQCHTYAAVRIDCFECHTDKPVDKARRTGWQAPPQKESRRARLGAHLGALERSP